MAKELIRVPRVLGESYNSVLIERLYEAGGNVMLDLIIYLGSYHLKDYSEAPSTTGRLSYGYTHLNRFTSLYGKIILLVILKISSGVW